MIFFLLKVSNFNLLEFVGTQDVNKINFIFPLNFLTFVLFIFHVPTKILLLKLQIIFSWMVISATRCLKGFTLVTS